MMILRQCYRLFGRVPALLNTFPLVEAAGTRNYSLNIPAIIKPIQLIPTSYVIQCRAYAKTKKGGKGTML